ncbi:MAG: hypothetical protein QM778_27230 [Myxococcales bacterium]
MGFGSLKWVGLYALGCALLSPGVVRAQAAGEPPESGATLEAEVPVGSLWTDPFSSEIRVRYYEVLRRSPSKAFLLDLALPGAGSAYVGLYGNTVVASVLSVAGASLWIAGAVKHQDALWWSGMGVFAGGRAYGLISAPVGARWFNAALQAHFGLREMESE